MTDEYGAEGGNGFNDEKHTIDGEAGKPENTLVHDQSEGHAQANNVAQKADACIPV
jgi:hypothetical protein